MKADPKTPPVGTLLECDCEQADGMLLAWSPERGFFEPVTNQLAEPVVGNVLAWKIADQSLF